MTAFDLTTYLTAMAAGTPILFLVWGLVEILKRLKNDDGTQKVSGNALFWISFVIGFTLGNLYMIYVTPPPTGTGWHPVFAYFFSNAMWGAGLGILASIFHDALKRKSEGSVENIAKTDDPTAGLP